MVNYRNTQNFAPRRDIVLGNKAPMSMDRPNTAAIPFGKNTNITRKQSLLSISQQRFQPLLAIILIWIIIPALKKHKNKSPKRFTTSFRENYNTPETILNMLSDVSPYLDLQEQDNIQTLIGIFEVINILNNIRAGTYQSPRILKNINLSANPQDRKLGIIKAIKPYLSSNNHEVIDKAIHTYNTFNRVSQSLVNYTSKTSDNVQTQNNIDRITEMFEIIAPIVPDKQRQMLNQIRKMIKMYTAMESSQLWEKWTQEGQKQSETQDAWNNKDSNTDNTNNTKESAPPDSNKQKKNISDTLKSVLNPEQSQAMEVMMKMAQLLSQESSNNEESHKKNQND